MRSSDRELGELRKDRSDLENHYIDELVSGRVSRRQFLRRGSAIGMSAPLLGAILAACGSSTPSGSTTPPAGKPKTGGTLRVAISTPAGAINPLTVSDAGGLCMLNQTGEFLIFDNNLKLSLEPMLALSWSPNSDGSVWTFKLRTGRHVQQRGTDDGRRRRLHLPAAIEPQERLQRPLDVHGRSDACRGSRRSTPPRSNSTSRLPTGTSPTSSPRITTTRSSFPTGTDFSSWQHTFVGTGAFKLGSYSQGQGATFVPNPDYWGPKALLSGTAVQVLLEPAAPDPGPPGGRRRCDRPVRARRSDVASEQLVLQGHQAQGGQPPRALDAQRPGALHRPARAPGGGVHAGPAGDGLGAAPGLRQRGQRLPVRTSVPVHGHVGRPAHAGHRQGQALLAAAGHSSGFSRHDGHRAVRGDPGSSPR